MPDSVIRLTDFTTLTFDCYGTLIDWEAGIIGALGPLTDRVAPALGRDAILEAHARHESSLQQRSPTMPYPDVLAAVCRRLADDWGVATTQDECVAYGRSVGRWPAFSDAAAALAYLRQHFRLAILSNVDNASLAASRAQLGVEFDALCTAEDIGAYKPSDRCFEYLLRTLESSGCRAQDILHVAESLYHDHTPANRHQIRSCWIHRRHDQPGFGATARPGTVPRYDFRFTSLAELVTAHRLELSERPPGSRSSS